jgi:hypothetical protein
MHYEDRLLRHWTLAIMVQSMIETFGLKGELNERIELEFNKTNMRHYPIKSESVLLD